MDHAEHNTSVIAIGNQKGGVAKTTNTAHIAAALGKLLGTPRLAQPERGKYGCPMKRKFTQ